MAEFFQWLSSGSVSAIVFIAILSILVLATVIIYTVAFFQGREISFWPPKIGQKPDRNSTQTVVEKDGKQKGQFDIYPSFSQGLIEILRQQSEYGQIDIFAHTSAVFYRTIFEARIKVKNLRVLLRDMRSLDDIQFPVTENDKQDIYLEWEKTIQNWKELKRSGQIENLSIKFYPFEPMMTFIVIDGKTLYFDLMKPQKDAPGSTSKFTPQCVYLTTDSNEKNKTLVQLFGVLYQTLLDEFNG